MMLTNAPILHRLGIMDILVLLLTLLCGMLITWIVAIHERNRSPPSYVPEIATTAIPTTAVSAEVPTRPFIVRVSGIPSVDPSQAEACVKSTVAELSNDEDYCISDITIVPACTDNDSLVAIVDFKILPDFLSPLKEGSSRSCQVPGRDTFFLHFDAEFLGFTQMYSTKAEPTADIVFISGIGSHAYGSWTSKSYPWQMWPRHFLPHSFPNSRVMIYGHKMKLRGASFKELLDCSRSFGDALKQARKKDLNRPIVFVAHSFGGNILKGFLIKDQQGGGLTLTTTRGIIFFAVPHRGMDMEDMIAAIQYKNTLEKVLRQTSKDAFWRQELDSFIDIIKDCKVASFYETELTQRLIMQSNGSFARVGEHIKELDPYSATLDLPRNIERKHPVDADHSDIIKFEYETLPVFTQVLDCLNEFLSASRNGTLKEKASSNKYLDEVASRTSTYNFSNSGCGAQFNNSGSGGQYNNTGSGRQYNTQV